MSYKRVKGFTLVEVIVAITILSLIVLATITAMQTLAITHARVESHAKGVAHMRAVTNFVRRSLEQAKPIYIYGSGRPVGQYFYGTEEQLLFAVPMPIPGQSGGLVSVRLQLNAEQQLIVRLSDTPIVDLQSADDGEVYVLASDITEFTINYRENRLAPWVGSWGLSDETAMAPEHVRLKIRQGERYWPLIIAPVAQL